MAERPQPRHGSTLSFKTKHPIHSAENVRYLTDEEVSQFVNDLDCSGDGYIDSDVVERKLDRVHEELVPQSGIHHTGVCNSGNDSSNDSGNDSSNDSRNDGHGSHDSTSNDLVRGILGPDPQRISRNKFAEMVREWKIPSLQQSKKDEGDEKTYFKRLPAWRKLRAYWAVRGPEIMFVGLVISMQVAFGAWQLAKYQTSPQYVAGFGWGVVLAKTCAGALYPTFFFLILSMSRYFSTWLRRSYHLSRFFNWDLSQNFHIWISCAALLLATLHTIGHLAGSFVHGSNPASAKFVAIALNRGPVPRYYSDYVRSLPGWTGIAGLSLFYMLFFLSTPQVRRWKYEVFQLGHLLMFPIIGLMMVHGAAALFQWPMFSYFLAFPALLVLFERTTRVLLGFRRIKATLRILDAQTVQVTATMPEKWLWPYKAGQYIFLQVPGVSFFQWHPFTVSFCRDNRMMVHIKTGGDWTTKLRRLGSDLGECEIEVGIDGPFGAPAQRFHDFSHSVIIGAGIGVTPFSGILSDLQHKDNMDHGGPAPWHVHVQQRHQEDPGGLSAAATPYRTPASGPDSGPGSVSSRSNVSSAAQSTTGLLDAAPQLPGPAHFARLARKESRLLARRQCRGAPPDFRRVDFHWMVHDRNNLLWLSDLLNEVSVSQDWHREHEAHPHLDIRINTHVTATHANIATHVYRWLLEMHRTEDHPASPLTGLLNPTHFGRPDFDRILDEHYEEMRRFRADQRRRTQAMSMASLGGSSEKSGRSSRSGSSISIGSSISSINSISSHKLHFKEGNEFKVGIFYCGAPAVGEILADKCRELTARGRKDGTRIEYHFMMEVFN